LVLIFPCCVAANLFQRAWAKGRTLAQLCAGIQFTYPFAVNILDEGGQLTVILVLQLWAALLSYNEITFYYRDCLMRLFKDS
jgi:hypothetical protein